MSVSVIYRALITGGRWQREPFLMCLVKELYCLRPSLHRGKLIQTEELTFYPGGGRVY